MLAVACPRTLVSTLPRTANYPTIDEISDCLLKSQKADLPRQYLGPLSHFPDNPQARVHDRGKPTSTASSDMASVDAATYLYL